MTAIEFNTEIVRYHNLLNGFAFNLTRNKEDASDLVQDTFLKALYYKDTFLERSNLKAWLITVMKNTFINTYKRNITKGGIMAELKYTQTQYYNNIETSVTVSDLNSAINTLKEKFKIPFLRFVDGYKYEEIASELSLPVGTVKSRIFTARTQIMAKMKYNDGGFNV